MHDSYKGPWLVGGDFNNVLGANEKIKGKGINNKRSKLLWDCINSCNLIDLGFKCCKFTLSNYRKKNNDLILERLDKVFANEKWISLFPKAAITHLPKTHSGHNPILIEIIPKNNCSFQKPFRLETY